MSIKWAALAGTAGVSIGITLAVVLLFAVGVASLSRRAAGATAGGRSLAPLAVATTSFAACAAAIAYGLYLIALG